MNNIDVFLFFSFLTLSNGAFSFNNISWVERIALDIGEDYCNCIVIQRSPNDTIEQKYFLDLLTANIAKGKEVRSGKQKYQTMSYFIKNYMGRYSEELKINSGNCFKWLNIIMVTEYTSEMMKQLTNPIYFKQAVWLFFTNSSDTKMSKDELFQNINMQLDSNVWLVEAQTDNSVTISEVYRIGKGSRERRISLGAWHYQDGLKFPMIAETVRRKDMDGTILRVGTFNFWPVTWIEIDSATGTIEVVGFYAEIWKQLESVLNFSTVYILPIQNNSGSLQKDGSWSGLLGMSVRNEIDVLLIELDYSIGRIDIVEYLLPISRTSFQIFSRVEGYVLEWLAVLRPFQSDIWTALLIWIVLGAFFLTIANYIAYGYGIYDLKMSYTDSVFFILRTLSYQGAIKVPKIITARILFLICYMVPAVVLPSYSAALISSLAKKTPTKPFDSLKELFETDYKLMVPEQSSSFDYFAQSTNPKLKNLVGKDIYNPIPWNNSYDGYELAIRHLCANRRTAIFTVEAPMLKSIRELPFVCELQTLSQPVLVVYQSLALAKKSPFRSTINHMILKMMETGIIRRFERIYIRPRPLKPMTLNNPVCFGDVSEVFIFLFISYFLCIVILYFERRNFR